VWGDPQAAVGSPGVRAGFAGSGEVASLALLLSHESDLGLAGFHELPAMVDLDAARLSDGFLGADEWWDVASSAV
jgi:hypothetical protein